MFDTHAHIHDAAFEADRDAVIRRAKAAGIERIVTVGCDVDDSRRAIVDAQRYGISAAVGVHPHEAKGAPEDVAVLLSAMLARPPVVAIGETGLDFYYDHSPRDAQERLLRAQIRIARERDFPVIFHVRDAHERMLEILREEFSPEMHGVVHCFTGNAEQARAYTGEFGLLLGIGGIVTFKNAAALCEAVRAVGLDALLLETDCPYLAPVPMRGKRNEPAFMTYTAEHLCAILGVARADLIAATTRNAQRLFPQTEA